MPVKPNTYRDVVFFTDAVPALVTWFESLAWDGWIPAGDPELQRGFNSNKVVAVWRRNGPLGICYLRLKKEDYDFLVASNPPLAAINILANKDPYGPLTFVDPENPTEAELNANNVVYSIKGNTTKVALIRSVWPREVTDGDSNTTKRGLKFANLGDRWADPKGDLELD